MPQVGAGGCGSGSGSGSSSRRGSRLPSGTDSAARAGSSPLPLEKCCCHLMSSCSSVTLCGVGGAGGHPPLPPPLPEWEQPAEPAVSPQTQLSKPPACVPKDLGAYGRLPPGLRVWGRPGKLILIHLLTNTITSTFCADVVILGRTLIRCSSLCSRNEFPGPLKAAF